MPNTQKVIYLFKTEHCAPCEALHDELADIVKGYSGIHIETVMCDDGDEGSLLATKLGVHYGTPHTIIAEHVVGRKPKDYYAEKIRRLCDGR